jgi:hypothetical protein
MLEPATVLRPLQPRVVEITPSILVKEVILDIDTVSKNNFDHYLFATKNLQNIVNIYFYETTFQDEAIYIVFIFSNSTQKIYL